MGGKKRTSLRDHFFYNLNFGRLPVNQVSGNNSSLTINLFFFISFMTKKNSRVYVQYNTWNGIYHKLTSVWVSINVFYISRWNIKCEWKYYLNINFTCTNNKYFFFRECLILKSIFNLIVLSVFSSKLTRGLFFFDKWEFIHHTSSYKNSTHSIGRIKIFDLLRLKKVIEV